MKFAMVPINTKMNLDENGVLQTYIRRVLVSYKFKTVRGTKIIYHGTKFIIADQYFYSYDSSHQYVFKDKYYLLQEYKGNEDIGYDQLLSKKRKYHSTLALYKLHSEYCEDEFEADNEQQAIEKFNSRLELR